VNDPVRDGPSRIVLAKIALVIAGIVVFGLGIRWNHAGVRWGGIALVAVAWAMRFVRR